MNDVGQGPFRVVDNHDSAVMGGHTRWFLVKPKPKTTVWSGDPWSLRVHSWYELGTFGVVEFGEANRHHLSIRSISRMETFHCGQINTR